MLIKSQFFRNLFWVYFFGFMITLLGYFLKILYANNLPILEFGLLYSIIGLLGLISIFNDLGFTETLNYFGVKYYEKKEYLKLKQLFFYAYFMQTFSAIIISIIIYFSSSFLIRSYFKISPIYENILIFFLVYFIFSNSNNALSTFFVVSQKYFYNNLYNFLNTFLILIFSSFLIFFNFDLKFIALLWGLVQIFLTILFFYFVKKEFKKLKSIGLFFDINHFKKVFRYAIQVFLGSGAMILILAKTDIFFITLLMNVSNVGLYEIAFSLALILVFLISSVNNIVFSYTTKLLEENKKEKLNEMITQIYRFFLICGMPLMILFIFFSKEIVLVLFGERYIEASNLLKILSFGMFFALFQRCNHSILAGMGKIKQRNKLIYIAGFLNIILNYFLILKYGIVGVAYSTIIVFIFLFFGSFYLIEKDGIRIRIKFSMLLKILFCNLIFLIIVFSLKKYLSLNIYLESLVVLFISGTFYLILILILKCFRIEEIKKIIFQSN